MVTSVVQLRVPRAVPELVARLERIGEEAGVSQESTTPEEREPPSQSPPSREAESGVSKELTETEEGDSSLDELDLDITLERRQRRLDAGPGGRGEGGTACRARVAAEGAVAGARGHRRPAGQRGGRSRHRAQPDRRRNALSQGGDAGTHRQRRAVARAAARDRNPGRVADAIAPGTREGVHA